MCLLVFCCCYSARNDANIIPKMFSFQLLFHFNDTSAATAVDLGLVWVGITFIIEVSDAAEFGA